jgi:hypothetical protein
MERLVEKGVGLGHRLSLPDIPSQHPAFPLANVGWCGFRWNAGYSWIYSLVVTISIGRAMGRIHAAPGEPAGR